MKKHPILSLTKVTKMFPTGRNHSIPALKNISLAIETGEFFVFVGPSGCGKSTILRIMSNLEKEYRGTLTYSPDLALSDISFVFQQFALLPWLTVYENIELNLIAKNIPEPLRRKNIQRELKRFHLEKFSSAYPKELSGGMRQRVGFARALATDPKVIFLDEPFSELDSFTAQELRKELLHIWEEQKVTIIMVTHIVEEAIELADRIAIMTPRPGEIKKVLRNTLGRPRIRRSEPFYTIEDAIYATIHP